MTCPHTRSCSALADPVAIRSQPENQHQIWCKPGCRAMNSCPLKDVRVVILGQDPYHDVGQAMGLSFSVPAGKTVCPSTGSVQATLQMLPVPYSVWTSPVPCTE